MTTDRFIPPAAEGLPEGALDSATEGANRLDAWALDPRGRNFLAHALVQLARDGWLRTAPAAVPVPPPADQTALRDRIRRVLCVRDGQGALWGTDMLEPDEYGDLADAVLAVPPEQTDRAALLRQEADQIRAHCPDHLDSDSAPGAWMVCHCDVADDMLRRVAAEEQPAECTASISRSCLAEGQSETACDTEAGECVYGGRPAAEEQPAETQEAPNPRTVCTCGHTRGEHLRVSGRLLCDACDPDSTNNLVCRGFDAL